MCRFGNVDEHETCCYEFVSANSKTLVLIPLINFILFWFIYFFFQIKNHSIFGTRLKFN